MMTGHRPSTIGPERAIASTVFAPATGNEAQQDRAGCGGL